MKDEQANEKLEDDIKELALICVTEMRKAAAAKVAFKPKANFNKNQTVKGIRQIELIEMADGEEESFKSHNSSI